MLVRCYRWWRHQGRQIGRGIDRLQGQAYGSTSADGMDIKDKPCSIGDLFATVYKGLGLDPTSQVRDNLGRPMAIADGKPLEGVV